MQKDIETKIERRTQCSTSGKLFNNAQHGAGALVEIQFFLLFDSFFVFFLLFCITQIGMTPSLRSSGWKVWPRAILRVLAQILK
jgi:hypothetical protein